MSENYMKKANHKSLTDWSRVNAMTEEEIMANALSDPDNPPLTLAELKKFKRANPIKKIDVKAIREKLQVSQGEFARYFGVSIRTLQEWEQHRSNPSPIARNFLKVIDEAPRAVLKALANN